MSLDLQFALRQLRRNPAFTLAAALTLALGVAATTTVFSFVDAVLLRPLPYPEPSHLLSLERAARRGPGDALLSKLPGLSDQGGGFREHGALPSAPL